MGDWPQMEYRVRRDLKIYPIVNYTLALKVYSWDFLNFPKYFQYHFRQMKKIHFGCRCKAMKNRLLRFFFSFVSLFNIFWRLMCFLNINMDYNEILVTLCFPLSNYLLGVRDIKFCSNLMLRSTIGDGYKTGKWIFTDSCIRTQWQFSC